MKNKSKKTYVQPVMEVWEEKITFKTWTSISYRIWLPMEWSVQKENQGQSDYFLYMYIK